MSVSLAKLFDYICCIEFLSSAIDLSEMGVIIKNSIKATVINFIGAVLGMISLLLVQTSFLQPDQIGDLRLILDKAIVLVPFVIIGIDTVSSRFYFHFDKDKTLFGGFMTFILGVPFIIFLIAIPFLFLLQQYLEIKYLLLILILLFCNIYIRIFEDYLTSKAKIIIPALLKSMYIRILTISLVLVYHFKLISFDQLLLGYTLGFILHFALLALYFKHSISYAIQFNLSIFKHPIFKEIATYCGFMTLGMGSGILVSRLDTPMIESITNGSSASGIFTVALSIATIIELPRRPISKLSNPILSKSLKEKDMGKVHELYQKSALNLLIISIILFSLIWVNLDNIFKVIPKGHLYSTGKNVVLLIGVARIIDLGLGVNNQILNNSKHYKWNIILSPILAVTSILLNLYFIPIYGITGAAIATCASLTSYNISRTILVYLKMNIHPFSKQYFINIPLMFIAPAICYFITIENNWLSLFINSFVVLITFCIPVYFLKLSSDLNGLVDSVFKKFIKS